MDLGRRMLRHPVAVAVLLAVAAAAVGWSELTGYAWTDYEAEAEVPLFHLVHGQLGLFAQTAPAYVGSLIIRAPFALLPWLWGGGPVAVYRAVAVPCLLAGAGLGWVLWRERRRRFPAAPWALVFALLAAANPVTFRALSMGHPEELLGAALCAGAVLAALRRRPWLAAVLLGLAIGNKAWAVLAIGPVLVALDGRRLKVLMIAGAITVAAMSPMAFSHAAGSRVAALSVHTSVIFQPWQAWWPLGEHGHVVRGNDGQVKPGYRTPPAWLSPIAHPLIALLVVPFTLLWLRRRRGASRGAPEDVLLLLAFLMLLRCVLDPFDIGYYHLPFLLALLAWEALQRPDRPPVMALLASATVWVMFDRAPDALRPDMQSLLFLALSLPLAAWMARAAFASGAPRSRHVAPTRAVAAVLPSDASTNGLSSLPGWPLSG
jgi:glycosyl transferase family 87